MKEALCNNLGFCLFFVHVFSFVMRVAQGQILEEDTEFSMPVLMDQVLCKISEIRAWIRS